LTLVGGVDESKGTQGRFVITAGVRSAYEDWAMISERTIRFVDDLAVDGLGDIQFGSLMTAERVPAFVSGEIPSMIERHPNRKFDSGRWKAWRTMDMPCFDKDGAMIWCIEDRLFATAQSLGWESSTHAVSSEARVVGPKRPGFLRPWSGLGWIEESSREGPWVTVRMKGFEAGDDLARVRIGTPYSGSNGRRGLHMVPEKGTEVILAWSGRFDQSIVIVGNARSESAEFVSPSTYLEAEHTAQYADIHVGKIGDITVDSKLALRVKQRTDVSSAQQLEVKADGADLKMTGGVVYTGRGV
jgi:hypothetical protein